GVACLTGAAAGLAGLAEAMAALVNAVFVAGCDDAFAAAAGEVGCSKGARGDAAACLIGAAGALGRIVFLRAAELLTGGVCLFILFFLSFTDVIFTFRFNFSKLAKNHQAKWSISRGVTHCTATLSKSNSMRQSFFKLRPCDGNPLPTGQGVIIASEAVEPPNGLVL